MLTGKPINYFMSPYSYFSLRLSSKHSEVICTRMTKTRFCDSDVMKNVLKFQIFSVLKIKITCAQACCYSICVIPNNGNWLRFCIDQGYLYFEHHESNPSVLVFNLHRDSCPVQVSAAVEYDMIRYRIDLIRLLASASTRFLVLYRCS